jgi:hypothetical protein
MISWGDELDDVYPPGIDELKERRPRTVREMVGFGFFPDEVALPDTYPDLCGRRDRER